MTDDPVEFVCEGCGLRVVSFGVAGPPAHRFCEICAWLDAHEASERIMELRRRIEPGGWESEREQRRIPAPNG